MPDDLSGWGYCGKCHAIHERDEDGLMCDDDRPLPRALVPREPSWLQRLLDRIFHA
jgi:hypothetical protein